MPELDRPEPSVLRERYRGCADGRRVESLTLIGAGHTWAGSPNPLLELVAGPTNTDISATATVGACGVGSGNVPPEGAGAGTEGSGTPA